MGFSPREVAARCVHDPALLFLDPEPELWEVPVPECPRCGEAMTPVETEGLAARHCAPCRYLALERGPLDLLPLWRGSGKG